MEAVVVTELTCSEADKDWSLALPPVANTGGSKVTITMTTASSVFVYND